MTKKKKAKSSKHEGGGSDAATGAFDSAEHLPCVPEIVQRAFGKPLIAAQLVGATPTSTTRVYISSDDINEAKLVAGTLVAVAITMTSYKAGVPSRGISAFAPAPLQRQDMQGLQPVNLEALLSNAREGEQEGQERLLDAKNVVARYFVLAEVWPGRELQKGMLQLARPLWDCFGQPTNGRVFLAYVVSPGVLGVEDGVPPPMSKGDCGENVLSEQVVLSLITREVGGSTQPIILSDGQACSTPLQSLEARTRWPSDGPTGLGASPTASLDAASARPAGGPPVKWLMRALCKGGDRQRSLLSQLAARHLDGRHLVQGNLVTLPTLGCTLLCQVDVVKPHSPVKVSWKSTQILLTLGDEAPRANKSGVLGGETGMQADAVRMARDAAEKSSEGSSKAAAGDAAERAILAGRACLQKQWAGRLGGVDGHLSSLRALVSMPLQSPEMFETYGIRPPRGVVLYGSPGTGKTVLACAAAQDAGACLLVVNGPDIISEHYGGSEAALRGVFAAARALAPSVVFLDEIDAIMPGRGNQTIGPTGGEMSNRLVATLLTIMDGIGGAGRDAQERIVVMAATSRLDTIDPALRRPGRFDRELEVGVPLEGARKEILTAQLKSISHRMTPGQLDDLAAAAHGFVAADLVSLCHEAAMSCLRRTVGVCSAEGEAGCLDMAVGAEDFAAAKTLVMPGALREIVVQVPRVLWDDIGGLDSVKQRLKEVVLWPILHKDRLKAMGARSPSGVLLYGPPGCSKTLLARAIATESRMNFLPIKGSELLSAYVGESEKAIARLFGLACQVAPSIVFFDEVDGLAGTRGSGMDGGTGLGDRVLAQLLTELDGVQARSGVVVIGATNKPDHMDPALLRPGRFDRLVYVPAPDEASREAIFRIHLRCTPLAGDVDCRQLAREAAGCTGADIAAICREAGLLALDEDLECREVGMRHLCAAVAGFTPSAPTGGPEVLMYESFQMKGG